MSLTVFVSDDLRHGPVLNRRLHSPGGDGEIIPTTNCILRYLSMTGCAARYLRTNPPDSVPLSSKVLSCSQFMSSYSVHASVHDMPYMTCLQYIPPVLREWPAGTVGRVSKVSTKYVPCCLCMPHHNCASPGSQACSIWIPKTGEDRDAPPLSIYDYIVRSRNVTLSRLRYERDLQSVSNLLASRRRWRLNPKSSHDHVQVYK